MTAPIAPIQITFTGDTAAVAAAVRQLTSQITTLGRSTRDQAAGNATLSRSTTDMAGRLAAAERATDIWGRGLLRLRDNEIAAAQAAATAGKQVSDLTARMAQGASGSESFARGLRTLAAQRGSPIGPPLAPGAGSAVDSFVGKLGSLAKAYIGIKAVSFLHEAIEQGAALHDLAQQTGATVETLSILKLGAERAEVSLDDVAVGTKKLAVTLGQLRDGDKAATELFGKLGLSARDFIGLSVDQALLKVFGAVSQLTDGFEKQEVAQGLFGRSGAALIPLMNDLAGNGFARLSAEAERLGLVISTQDAAAADEFSDSLKGLEAVTFSLARGLTSDLLPSLVNLIHVLE
ncbi:MAG: hypothetical protein ACREL3_07495, partial [Gemmatimonadales bacterium]